MFGIHGHSLHLLARPIKGHASFKSWQPCADNQSGEWGDLAAEISFAIQSRSDLSRALSVQFDTHRKTSLLASLVQLWAVSPTDLHFPGLSFPFIPVLSFYVNSIRSLTLTTFRDIFLGSSKALEYIVAAPWRTAAPTDTKVWPIRTPLCFTWDKLLFHLENNYGGHLASNPCYVSSHVSSLWGFSANVQFSMRISTH